MKEEVNKMGFWGIQCGSNGYRLQQLVNDNGKLIQKTSEIVFWFVIQGERGTAFVPITKYDLTSERYIVPSQITSAMHDKTRCIIGKNSEGNTSIVALGAIYRY